jgi:hypothetical protein
LSKRQRFERPYTPVKGAHKKKATTLHATSTGTGLRHSFKNPEDWGKYSSRIQLAKVQKDDDDFMHSLPFFHFLQKLPIELDSYSHIFNSPVFRFANPIYGATTIVGSVSDGGRFNIGAAQARRDFPSLNKAGCLYVSSTKECALAEAAPPHGVLRMYQLNCKKEIRLWDLSKVIKDINYPNLLDHVKLSDGEALWIYRKSPAIPQILASKLRSIGGDGIIFDSTKLPGHSNIALFFKTDDESAKFFDVIEVQKN